MMDANSNIRVLLETNWVPYDPMKEPTMPVTANRTLGFKATFPFFM